MRTRALLAIASILFAGGCELITRPGEVRFVDSAVVDSTVPLDARADTIDSTIDTMPPTNDAMDVPVADVPEDRPVMVDGVCTGVMCGSSCVDPLSDPMHCGSCTGVCPGGENATPVCTGARCGLQCSAGFGDCNHSASDGCEAPLDSDANCGACGLACVFPNAAGRCVSGACTLTCNSGFGDCDGIMANGCETPLTRDDAHCGTCANACAADTLRETYTCTAGSCRLACAANTLDCDSMTANGCETDVISNANCGSCGNMCASGRTCQAAPSGPACCFNTGQPTCGMGCIMGRCEIIFGGAWCCF